MKVTIAFDSPFTGPVGDALWITDSETNRHRFEDLRERLDPNSAIFKPGTPALNVLWAAQEHHPDWRVIETVGLPLSEEIERAISSEGRTICTDTGFQLIRNQ
jgi:hypothetical protein